MAIGLVHPDGIEVYGYGRVDDDSKRPPTGDTIFEIGSVSKVFTALLLAEMVERHQAQLDEAVKNLLPATAIVPRKDGQEIELLHLATHTSGLPSLPTNFAPADPNNPYADYTVAQLHGFLAGVTLASAPGRQYDYSNLGAGLLGHALSLRAGTSYESLILERIAKPLGMTSTTIALTSDAQARLAKGHDPEGKPVANWDFPTLAGAGAIRSSVNDLVRLLRANLDPPGTALGAAMRVTHVGRFPRPGGQVALGWHIGLAAPGLGEIRWHNGATGGYHSFLAFDPAKQLGVVVLANSSQDIDQLGISLLLLLRGEPHPLALPRVAAVDPAVLQRYVGRYQLAPNFAITVTLDGKKLYAQATGQPRFRLYPESETKFNLRVVDAQTTFVVEPTGKVTGLVVHQDGRDSPGTRVE